MIEVGKEGVRCLYSLFGQRAMEQGSTRDMARNPEEHPSFMGSPKGIARMDHENQREQNL